LARRDFAPATLSTFGIGDDYDEDLMSALAAQAGGRARYIDSPQMLAGAFRDELSRAAALVARGVRVRVAGLHGASLERVFGYEPEADGWVRLPDFAAGEERRVLIKLAIPAGRGLADIAAVELAFEDVRGVQRGHARWRRRRSLPTRRCWRWRRPPPRSRARARKWRSLPVRPPACRKTAGARKRGRASRP